MTNAKAWPRRGVADVLEPDDAAAAPHLPLAQQAADVGALDAGRPETIGQHADAVRLLQPVAEHRHPVVQRGRQQPPAAGGVGGDEARVLGQGDRGLDARRDHPGRQTRAPQHGDLGGGRPGVVQDDRLHGLVDRPAQEHPGQAEAVVAVGVGDADAVIAGRGHAGEQHLPLGALAGVEQDRRRRPSAAGSRCGCGGRVGTWLSGAEDDELARGHAAKGRGQAPGNVRPLLQLTLDKATA